MKMKKSLKEGEKASYTSGGRRSLRKKPIDEDKRNVVSSKKGGSKKEQIKKGGSNDKEKLQQQVEDATESKMNTENSTKSAATKSLRRYRRLKGSKGEGVKNDDDKQEDNQEKDDESEEKDDETEKNDEDQHLVEEEKAADEDATKAPEDKNGKMPKGRKRRKVAPKIAAEEEQVQWTPLEELASQGSGKRDVKKITQSTNDRRKQALVERAGAAEVMLQTRPKSRKSNDSDASDCEVLENHPKAKKLRTIETVNIEDDQSEDNFCEIVSEQEKESTFDFRKIYLHCRNVRLPSCLWGVHRDTRGQFVAFTRFNSGYPNTNAIIVDRAVVFHNSVNPKVFVNNESCEIPDMFHAVETLVEVAQVIQHAHNLVAPIEPVPSMQ